VQLFDICRGNRSLGISLNRLLHLLRFSPISRVCGEYISACRYDRICVSPVSARYQFPGRRVSLSRRRWLTSIDVSGQDDRSSINVEIAIATLSSVRETNNIGIRAVPVQADRRFINNSAGPRVRNLKTRREEGRRFYVYATTGTTVVLPLQIVANASFKRRARRHKIEFQFFEMSRTLTNARTK